VKLLLDEHLSPKLAKRLQDIFPGSSQVDLLEKKAPPTETFINLPGIKDMS